MTLENFQLSSGSFRQIFKDVEQLISFEFDITLFKVAVFLAILCLICSFLMRETMSVFSDPNNEFFNKFLKESEIQKSVFQPHPLGLTSTAQSALFILYELAWKQFYTPKYKRELFTCRDKGTLGIDWYCTKDHPEGKPNPDDTRPILLIAPGLSGSSHMFCFHDMSQEALKAGYRVGVMLFRGTNNIPMTTFKVSCSVAWEDVQDMVDYVHKNYVIDPVTKKKKCQFYGYGVSLGANQLGLYLSHSSENCVLDGASLFAFPHDVARGAYQFYEVAWFSSWVIGQFLSSTLLEEVAPKVKSLTTEKEAERFVHVLSTNRNGLRTLDEHIYAPMYGFKNVQEYYNKTSVGPIIHQVRVPTIVLNAYDDQICAGELAPIPQATAKGSKLMVAMTKRGNHAAHLAGLIKPYNWAAKPLIKFYNFIGQEAKLKSD